MDLSPVYQPLIAALWYLFPLAIMAGLIKASFATDQAHARHVRGLVAERYGHARLLRNRDKACAQYKALKGEAH